jgi:hypothetical protein
MLFPAMKTSLSSACTPVAVIDIIPYISYHKTISRKLKFGYIFDNIMSFLAILPQDMGLMKTASLISGIDIISGRFHYVKIALFFNSYAANIM